MIVFYTNDKNSKDVGVFIDAKQLAYAPNQNNNITIAGTFSNGNDFSQEISRNGKVIIYSGDTKAQVLTFDN